VCHTEKAQSQVPKVRGEEVMSKMEDRAQGKKKSKKHQAGSICLV